MAVVDETAGDFSDTADGEFVTNAKLEAELVLVREESTTAVDAVANDLKEMKDDMVKKIDKLEELIATIQRVPSTKDSGETSMKAQMEAMFKSKEEEQDLKDVKIKELEKILKDLQNESGEKDKTEEKKGRPKQSMADRRGFGSVQRYGGNHEEFDDWKFRMTTFLSEEVEFNELLLKLEDLTEIPDEKTAQQIIQSVNTKFELKDDFWVNHQMYQVLCLNLEGKALKMVKNLSKQSTVNGILGWCKLAQDCSSMTSSRMQGLAQKVYLPERIKNYVDVNAAIEEWEKNAQLFSSIEKHDLNMTTKIFAIRKIVPEELEKDIIRSTSLDTYDKVRAYIVEQVAIRRDVKNASKGPVSLNLNMAENMWSKMMGEQEIDVNGNNENENDECGKCEEGTMLEQLFSFVKGQYGKGGKGGKDGGKGGKGKFDGNCHFCGTYGHRISDCWKKDAEMSSKGKGKKGDPFAAFGKGGFGGGFGGSGSKGKGKGGFEAGKGKGKWGKGAYGFENNYDYEDYSAKTWTLNMTANKGPKEPPGLKQIKTENPWKVLEESNESEQEKEEQRQEDLKGMESESKKPCINAILGNYSKKSIRTQRFPPIKAQKMKAVNLFFKEEVVPEKKLFPVTKTNDEGWQWIEGVVDSGAAESVAHPTMCPQYPVLPSAGSKAGHSYTSATGDTIPNLGEQVLPVITSEGKEACLKYQSADVSRALNSVSEICDGGGEDGQLVLFSKHGGQILNLESGHRTQFQRQDGIYTLGMWVRPNNGGAASVFPRPGR